MIKDSCMCVFFLSLRVSNYTLLFFYTQSSKKQKVGKVRKEKEKKESEGKMVKGAKKGPGKKKKSSQLLSVHEKGI